jgi:hypothetical protein
MTKPGKQKNAKLRLVAGPAIRRVCGLCGRGGKLTTTECCGNVICDDLDTYVTFSYARNSCYRNHSNQTICAYHHHEEHAGSWQECLRCRGDQEPEMYAWFATNEYNFEKLQDPPRFEPTLCSGCGKRIILSDGGYTFADGKRWCESCEPQPAPSKPRSARRRRSV